MKKRWLCGLFTGFSMLIACETNIHSLDSSLATPRPNTPVPSPQIASSSPLELPQKNNQKPIIRRLTASPDNVLTQTGKITFQVEVDEPENEPVELIWDIRAGKILSQQDHQVIWQPLNSDGSHPQGLVIIQVIARDPHGQEDISALNIWIDDKHASLQTQPSTSSTTVPGLAKPNTTETTRQPDSVLSEKVLSDIVANSQLPTTPTNLQARPLDGRSLQVSWEKVSAAASYRLYVNQQLTVADILTAPYTLNQLTPNTKYQLQISAISQHGESPLSEALLISTPQEIPVTPTGLKVSQAGTEQLTLQWNSSAQAQFYRLYASNTLIADHIQGTNYQWFGREANTQYPIQISAVNEAGESDKSPQILAQTLQNAPLFTGKIFFVHRLSPQQNDQIYKLSSGLSPLSVFSSPFQYLLYLTATSDGQTLLYPTAETGEFALHKLSINTGKTKQVTTIRAYRGDISKDGSKVVFAANPANLELTDIYTSNIDGSNLQVLASHEAWDEFPSWSPDGKKIAFLSLRDGYYAAYVMNADGSQLTRINTQPLLKEGHLEWANSGNALYCATHQGQIQKLDLSSGTFSPIPGMNENTQILDIALSPDNSQIAFIATLNGKKGVYLTPTLNYQPQFLAESTGNTLEWSN